MEPPPGTGPRAKKRRHIDWELVACGFRGHVLVGTDARDLGPDDAPFARAGQGVRWHRCLRCDSWVALDPPAEPRMDRLPSKQEIDIPLRGPALRDRVVLRVIAVERAIHFIVLGLLGIAVLVIAANQRSLRGSFYRVVTALQSGVGGGPVQQNGNVGIVHELNHLFTLSTGTLRLAGGALLAYALLEGVEAIGLWLGKRWAEYLTFLATTILLIPEVYEIFTKASVLKVIGFLINLAVVVYLLFAKRLFGLRGGGAAEERERRSGMSWAAIERATPPPPG
jgi:uncharacterized membrane protein (DUF2068 family)